MNSLSHLFKAELEGRNLTADFLKGMAVVFMIQVHITELLAQPDFIGSGAGKVSLFLGGPPAAPLFMAVMGYFLAGRKKALVTGLLRGIKLIAGGILLNIFLNASLLYKIYTDEVLLNPWHYILGADILPLAGLSVMLIAIFRKVFNDNLWAGGVILIMLVLGNQILPHGLQQENLYIRYILAFLFTNEYWSYFPLFPWVIYPFAGYLFGLLKPRFHFTTATLRVLSGLLIVLLPAAGGMFFDDIVNLPRWYHHDLRLILFNVLFLAGYISLLRLMAEHYKQNVIILWTSWLGKNVTAAYVIQWILLGNAGTHLYRTIAWEWLGVWFAGVCAMLTILLLIFKRVKGFYIKWGS
ncbi:MAG: DUF1624 domain-containing protein [Ignavibacteriaceae bacterium]|nr:DUF1624 domain-containing protein [Ignavibacteriaceae bacterium]